MIDQHCTVVSEMTQLYLFYVFMSTNKQTNFQNKDQTATHEWTDVHKHGANGACVIYILYI